MVRSASIFASRAYCNGVAVRDIPLEQAGEWGAKPGHMVWIGLYEPEGDELAILQAQLGLDPLAIEDAGQAHERPKMQRYGDGLFIVVRTAELIDDRVTFGETHIFVGKAMSSPFGTARARPIAGCARSARRRRHSLPRARRSSSTASWISRSTII